MSGSASPLCWKVDGLRAWCRSPLSAALGNGTWEQTYFPGDHSDGLGSLSSQLNGFSPTDVSVWVSQNVVHSDGLIGTKGLCFNGPQELESSSFIPTIVVDRLNARTDDSTFH